MEFTSKSSSPRNTCLVASSASYTLQQRLPITYNETALSQIQGRQQVRILNNLSIPLPITSSDEESEADTPTEVEVDSPHQNQDASPTSRPRRLTPMTRSRVTIMMPPAIPHPDCSGGVTYKLDPRLLTNEQRNHQQGTPENWGAPLDQPSPAMTKGKTTNNKDEPEEATHRQCFQDLEALNFHEI